MYAYADRVCGVDLTTGEVSSKGLDRELVEGYIGGRGFTSKLQWDELGPDVDPFGPENVLIFAVGPLVGTAAPGSSRYVVGAKSPITGILGDGSAGGHFGPALKATGYDMLVIRGIAERPTVMLVSEHGVRLREANDLWGADTFETERRLRAEFGKEARVACIGPAGERLARLACIVSDGGRAVGRCGIGAVMGSKRLKAVVALGSRKTSVADPDGLKDAASRLNEALRSDPLCTNVVPKLGTTMWLRMMNDLGGLSTKNWQLGTFYAADEISGETLRQTYLVADRACARCSLACEKVVAVPEGKFKSEPTKIEYFALASFGAKCLNANLASIVKANELCNRYGMDVAELGAAIGFLMECYERGVLSPKDVEGLDLAWGNPEAVVKLTEMTAFRQGLGALISDGVRRAAESLGCEDEPYALTTKKVGGFCSMDPRVWKIYSSRWRTASRGGDHLRAQGPAGIALNDLPLKDAVRRMLFNEHACTLCEVLGVCKFVYGTYSSDFERMEKKIGILGDLYRAATGTSCDDRDLWTVTERLLNLERAVGVRGGIGRHDDDMPRRFIEEPLPDGPYAGSKYDINETYIDEYYRQRGWDMRTGAPGADKLVSLGLGEVSRVLRDICRTVERGA